MMADGKREALYDVAVHQTKWLVESIWSGNFDPIKAHPYKNPVPLVKSKELREFESRKGFQALGRALSQMAPKKKKKR